MSAATRSMTLGRQQVSRLTIRNSATSSFRQHLTSSVAAARSFSLSPRTFAGKETADSRDNADIAAAKEAEKQQSVQDAKSGKAQWREGLASESESSVKADRGDMKDAKGSIEELQKETAKAAQQEKNKSK